MIRNTLFFCIIIFVTFASAVYGEAEEMKGAVMPIVVNGDKVQFDNVKRKVTGIGNVSITYKDMKMTCDKIVVDIDKKEGVAEGRITLYQEGNIFTADKAVYDFEAKRGHLTNSGMQMEPWYGKGESVDKVGDKVFKLNKSYVTTCDFEEPHYRIEARTIKIYLGDRVTAWHVLFYTGDTPIMYVPYYNHPLEDNLPQVAIVPGRNSEWGAFLLTSWRYYFHPDSKGHVHLDWRSRRGHAEGLDYKYRLGDFGEGYARVYFTHDREPDEGQELGEEMPSERWRGQLRHKWKVDENTFMLGEYHRLSDQDFIKDFYYKEEYELEEQPPTYLTLVGAEGNYATNILWEQKVNKFFTVTEKLPEINLDIRKMKLFNHLNLYYKNESSYTRAEVDYARDTGRHETPGDNYNATRIDSYNELSHPFRLLGFLSVDPYVGSRETFYTQDARGNGNVTRDILTAGVDFYTRFYKIYDLETNFLNFDIHRMRHLIIPSVQYSYVREPNLIPGELLQFDDLDTLDHTNAATLSLQHKLQTKRRTADGKMGVVDILSLITKSEYIFKDVAGIENKLADYIEHELEIRPYEWMGIDVDTRFHRQKRRFDTVEADLSINKHPDLYFGLGWRYEKHANTQLTSQFIYEVNREDWKRHWAFNIYERYEIQEQKFQEQEYTITKDLHCWTGEMTCRVKNQQDYDFWVIFRLKAFPDLPFFFRTSYRGPDPGSTQKAKFSAEVM